MPAAAQTRAGTSIPNTARLDYSVDGAPQTVSSNPSILKVDELLSSRIVPHVPRVVFVPGRVTPVPFTLTNIGNGREAFCLSAEYDNGTVEGYAIDSDGDGLYEPAHDTMLVNGCTGLLEPGQSVELLALVRTIHGTIDTLTLVAHPRTGGGSPGDVVVGSGDGGSNGVTGNPGTAVITLIPQASADPTLAKSQSVLDPGGGATPARGAIVTYTLVASFPGFVADAVVSDPIPAGTHYVPGSLLLDGTALSDAADSDAGAFDGTSIRVALGDAAPASTRNIQFKVTIQ